MNPGVPLVLISGMNLSARLWDNCNFPNDTVTIIPSGQSIEANVEKILETLPSRFYLVGLSLGANVAMRLAAIAEDRIAAMALMATNPRAPTDTQLENWKLTSEAVESGLTTRSFQQQLLDRLLSPEGRKNRKHVDLTLRSAEEIPEATLIDQLSIQASRVDERPSLRKIQIPTLILAGSEDAMCPVENHKELESLIQNSELVVIQGAGHLIPIEKPQEVENAVKRLRDMAT